MTSGVKRVRRAVMGVPEKMIVSFRRGQSGFYWDVLERAVRSDVRGYTAVIDGGSLDDIMARLDDVPPALSGYAYEGVAMGLTGLDLMLPGKSRFREFLAGPGAAHSPMAHIGAGQALARLRRRPEPFLDRLDDPVLRWLVVEGYGFHLGLFGRAKYIDRQAVPRFLSPLARRPFDQGVGRSLWFSAGGDVARVAALIAAFTFDRHADLWLGVGLACCYVGGMPRQQIERLRDASAPHLTQVAAGAAFAAQGRHRVGHAQPDTDLACEVLCGMDSRGAATLIDGAFAKVPADVGRAGYEVLLAHTFEAFATSTNSTREEADGRIGATRP